MVSQSFVGSLKAGDKIGKYEVRAQVATGGMAIIYKAHDASLDRMVAVKQIAPHLAQDPRFVERFRSEAQTLARLSSGQANIVSVYELIELDGQLYMVMEFVEGTTLRTLMDRGPVPLQTGLGILLSTALGLRAMHAQNIVHRDLSPANVMIGQDGGLKITDFGLIGHSGGKTSLPMGTTKYMAPEMFTGGTVDPRADLYSLGFIAYEMFGGPQKFAETFKDVLRDEKAQQVRWMHWHSNPVMKAPPLKDIQPGVPPLISKIIERMMEKDPAKRFASADQIIRWFRRIFVMHVQGKSVSMSESENLEKEMEADTGTGAAGTAAQAAIAGGAAVPALRGARPGAAPMAGAAAGAAVGALPAGEKTAPLPKSKWTWQKAAFWAALLGGPLVMLGIGLLSWKEHQVSAGDRVIRAQVRQARLLFDGGDFKEAAARFEEIILDFPDQPLIVTPATQFKWMAKAEQALKDENLDGAQDFATRAEKANIDPRISGPFRKRLDARMAIKQGLAEVDGLLKEDQFDEAISRLELMQRSYAEINVASRIEEIKQAKTDKAWKGFVKAGDEAAAAGNVAAALVAYKKAQLERETPEIADKIAALKRNQAYEAFFKLGTTAFADKKYDEAIAAFTKAKDIKPSPDLDAKITLARVLKLVGEAEVLDANGLLDKALEKWKEVLALDPTNPKAQARVKLFNMKSQRDDFVRAGDTAMAQKKYKDALDTYTRALGLTDATDATLRARLTAAIKECRYQGEVQAAHLAEDAGEWDNARTHWLAAQGVSDTPQVKDALANLDVTRDFTQKVTVAKELEGQKKYLDAEKAWEDAQKVKDTAEVREHIHECRYQRQLAKGLEMAQDPSQLGAAIHWIQTFALPEANPKEKVYVQGVLEQLRRQLPAGQDGK